MRSTHKMANLELDFQSQAIFLNKILIKRAKHKHAFVIKNISSEI